MKRYVKKRRRRIDRKAMGLFMKDHCWGWRPPMKLRKIGPWTEEEVQFIWSLREAAIEAGRKRMVARGLRQYAKPGEPGYEEHIKFKEEENKRCKEAQEKYGKERGLEN